jgi:polypeptide N-acetylgalactosaminyltransferase
MSEDVVNEVDSYQAMFFNGEVRNPDHIKKDWHDHEFIEYEKKRVGIGEQGKPEFVREDEKEEETKLYKRNGFNGYLSDKISLNRSVPDIRHAGYLHFLFFLQRDNF